MTDQPATRIPLDAMTSDQLDQLYDERDQARQHTAAIAAQRDRLRIRMNALADRWDTALAVDKPYARTLRAEISVAPLEPAASLAVQPYTERGQQLWAFRCWGTDRCDGWLGLGHHSENSANRERDRHIAEEH
jgi:predicted aminopeptidase